MTTIKLKNGSGAPDAADLVQGEVALDLTNKRIYSENASGTVIEMGTSPSTIDINAGTIDGVTMATSDITVGAGKTLDVSAGTLTLANDQISGDKIQGGTIGSVTISTLTATSADINGGTIDGVTIGGASAGAITGTTITGTSFVTSGDMTFGDDDKAIFGAGSDLQIYHSGTSSRIQDLGTGNLIIDTDGTEIQLTSGNISQYMLRAVKDGAVTLYHNGTANPRLATTATGVNVTGNVGIGTSSPLGQLHVSNTAGDCNAYFQSSASGLGQLIFSDGAIAGKIAYRHATNALEVTVNGSERMRIDSSGNLLVGKTSQTGTGAGIELEADGTFYVGKTGDVATFNRTTSVEGTLIDFQKQGVAVGSIASVAAGMAFFATGVNNCGWHLSDNSAMFPMKNSALSDGLVDLGGTNNRFDDIYATNGTIQTSDRNEKQDIEELSEAEQRVAVAAKGLLRKFRWKSKVEEKGDDARIHFGIIAQDLQAAFESEGLDAGRYAMFIHSTWTDEETGEERSRMGVRYSELLAFIIAAI
jgi:hypothetical protein